MIRLTAFCLVAATLLVDGFTAASDRSQAPRQNGPRASIKADTGVTRDVDYGSYVVTRVLIDPALDNMQQQYFEDDPRFVGRLFTLQENLLSDDTGPPCKMVRRRWSRQTLATVLKAHSQRRNQAAARPPVPRDYGLPQMPAGRIAIVAYECDDPRDPRTGAIPGNAWSGSVGWALGGGRRAILWADEVILILEPRGSAPPKPSFPCAKAHSVTERTICADPSLANWDRSVAMAYALNLNGGPERLDWTPTNDPDALEAFHRRWLAERDRCGADRECLLSKMYGQVDVLMRRQY